MEDNRIGTRLREYVIKCVTYDWIFSKWYEKLIIVALLGYAAYKFVRFLF